MFLVNVAAASQSHRHHSYPCW